MEESLELSVLIFKKPCLNSITEDFRQFLISKIYWACSIFKPFFINSSPNNNFINCFPPSPSSSKQFILGVWPKSFCSSIFKHLFKKWSNTWIITNIKYAFKRISLFSFSFVISIPSEFITIFKKKHKSYESIF